MPDTPDTSGLVTELRSFFSTNQPVLGARIGAFLKKNFPSFDYRTQHKNLKGFLEAIFPGEVKVIGKSGPDDILELGPAGSQHVDPMIIRDAGVQDEGIEVFRNPTISGFLIYDPQRKQLLKSAKPVELVETSASGSLNVVRMSVADQRAIMGEFAKNYSAREDTRGLESVLEGDDPYYWQKFYLAVKRAKLLGCTR